MTSRPIKLVDLIPLETKYSSKKGKPYYPAIVWYKDLKISSRLDQSTIDKIIEGLHTKKTVQTIRNPDNLLYWQYPSRRLGELPKPLIIIDKRTEPFSICTTEGTIEHFGLLECQRQAAIVLQILGRHGYARFRRVTLSSFRIGETPEVRHRNLAMFEYATKGMVIPRSRAKKRGKALHRRLFT